VSGVGAVTNACLASIVVEVGHSVLHPGLVVSFLEVLAGVGTFWQEEQEYEQEYEEKYE
jgi:hypothetical protein